MWEFQMNGRDGTVCMYNRKSTSSGLDTIICGGFDDVMTMSAQVP
jgi:hypothetical protein